MDTYELDILLEKFLFSYPDALGVTFDSLELPIKKANGSHTELMEMYKDITILSVDESFNPTFSFIVTEEGTIIVFFIKKLHFVSVFVKGENPNKELARRMYDAFKQDFENIIDQLHTAPSI